MALQRTFIIESVVSSNVKLHTEVYCPHLSVPTSRASGTEETAGDNRQNGTDDQRLKKDRRIPRSADSAGSGLMMFVG